jgi:hypothetical protein
MCCLIKATVHIRGGGIDEDGAMVECQLTEEYQRHPNKSMLQYHYEYHIKSPRIELGPPWCEARTHPDELWGGSIVK